MRGGISAKHPAEQSRLQAIVLDSSLLVYQQKKSSDDTFEYRHYYNVYYLVFRCSIISISMSFSIL